jgi:anaerobic magnesium-protoporphyrin IX monomethyl ester cyclase
MNLADANAPIALVFAAMEDPGRKPATVSNAEHLGLAYLAGALRARGRRVEIINAEIEGLSDTDVVERLTALRPGLVGLSPVSLSMNHTLSILTEVKRRQPQTIGVLGGHLASMSATPILEGEPCVDLILRGDSEESFSQLIDTLIERGDLGAVPGLSYRADGQVVQSCVHGRNPDLDALPRPARDGLEVLRRNDALTGARILASRGCHYNCSFCTTPAFYGRAVRFRNAKAVIEEMDDLAADYGLKHFWFNDDLFVNGSIHNTRWIEEFTRGVRTRGYTFRVLCRADSFRARNHHVLQLLKDAGLVHVFLGLEAGTPEALAVYNKRTTVEKNKAAVRLLKESGIAVQIGYIMFNPYSTLDELLSSANFLHEIGELYRFFPLTLPMSVFPGTPIADRLKTDGLLERADYREPLTCFRYIHDEIAWLVEVMHDMYERYNVLDNHILSTLGYDGVRGVEAVRRDLADINLGAFTSMVSALRQGRKAEAAAAIGPWTDMLQACLETHGLSEADVRQREREDTLPGRGLAMAARAQNAEAGQPAAM